MNIDFELKSKDKVTSGLVMELIPISSSNVDSERDAIYFDEKAFGFVEPCISKSWPAYANYGHWSTSKIPSDVWKKVLECLFKLRDRWHQANCNADVLEFLGYTFENIKEDLNVNFTTMKGLVTKMIAELILWLEKRLSTCTHITIVGI